MSKLSEFLKEHLQATSRSQKDVAGAFQTEYRTLGGKELAMNTLEPKLSKLLSGDAEGERFFLEDPTRLKAFSRAISVPEADLQRLRDIRTLVLSPQLPKEAREYFQVRAEQSDARHVCVVVSSQDAWRAKRDELRQAKDKSSLLVVLADVTDQAFFEGAEIEFSATTKHARGWVLDKAPELVLLDPPPDPKLFGNFDVRLGKLGQDQPMIPADDFAAHLRTKRSSYGTAGDQRITEMDRLGIVPTFFLQEVGPWLAERDARPKIAWGRPPNLEWDFTNGQLVVGSTTFVWALNRKLYVGGPEAEWVRKLVAPHHEAFEPTCLDALRTAISQSNPWVTLPHEKEYGGRDTTALQPRYLELQSAMEAEGFSLESIVKQWWAHRDPESETNQKKAASHWSLSVSDETERDRALANLEALLGRTFELDWGSASLLFRLKLVLESEVATIERQPGDLLHLVANVGAGHLIRVRVLEFPHEAPTIRVQRVKNTWDLDGGDVHILIRDLRDDVALEASPIPALRRREEARLEEKARAWDD